MNASTGDLQKAGPVHKALSFRPVNEEHAIICQSRKSISNFMMAMAGRSSIAMQEISAAAIESGILTRGDQYRDSDIEALRLCSICNWILESRSDDSALTC